MLLLFVTLGGSLAAAAGQEKNTEVYDIAAGDAVVTLRQFVRISGAQVVYFINDVSGIRTKPVIGEYRAHDALREMLRGTKLFYVIDETSGAISINQAGTKTSPLLGDPIVSQPQSDESGRVVRLSPFNVLDNSYHGYVASSTLIGGKTAREILEVPQTVNVVTRDILDDMGAVSVTDALIRLVPGVSGVNSTGSSGAGTYIRGFRSQNWSVDGATMRTLNRLTTFNIETIEVIKGPASVTFGAFAAYGGYVSLLPKYANRNHRNKVQFEVGTDDHRSAMIDVGGMHGEGGPLQWRLVLGALSADRAGWDYDFGNAFLVAPSFAYDFSDHSHLRVRFALTETDAKNSTTALDTNGHALRSFSSNGPRDDYHNRERGQSMQAVWETELHDEWNLKLNFFGALGDIDWMFNDLHNATTAASDYSINPAKRLYDWRNFYLDLSIAHQKKELGHTGISYRAVGSLSMDHWRNTYTIWDVNQYAPWRGYRIDPADPDWSLLPTKAELIYPTRYIYYNTEWLGGAVLENVLGFFDDRLLLSVAARYNYDNRSSHTAWREPRTHAPGGDYVGSPVPTNINEKITKRFGLVYKPTDKMSIYAGSTEAFLAVGAIFKADGSRLEPETGKNEEIGLKLDMFEAFGGSISFTGAIFRINVVNKWRGDPDNAGFFIQDGAQESEGVDLQLSYTSQKLSALLGFFDARGPIDKRSGERAVFVPETTWNFWIKYNLTARFTIGGGFKHIGDTIANDRRYTTKPFATGDIFASYTVPWRHGIIAYRLGISNLTDDDAVFLMNSAATVFREEGRRIKLSAAYTW